MAGKSCTSGEIIVWILRLEDKFLNVYVYIKSNAGFARNPTKASTPALKAYGICRAVSAVLRLSIFLLFMADFQE